MVGLLRGVGTFSFFTSIKLHPQQSLERRQEAEQKRRLAISSNKHLY